MADVAAGMGRPLFQEDRLDAGLEEFVVERRRRARRHVGHGSRRQHDGRHDDAYRMSRHVNPPGIYFLAPRTKSLHIESRFRSKYLFGRMILSEKSVTFQDHALGNIRQDASPARPRCQWADYLLVSRMPPR